MEGSQRAIGCAGLDRPYAEWPYKHLHSEIWASPAMDCAKQTYRGLADIVERFATDQQYWSGETCCKRSRASHEGSLM